jgi:anti-sigma B factor antagonist
MTESTSAPIEIEVERSGQEATVVVRGEIDLSTCDQLSATFAGLSTAREVHLDLSGVEYMDSTGLRAILAGRADLSARGAALDVVAASTIVARLIEITGLGELVADDAPAADGDPG